MLAGLFTAALADPALARARDLARSGAAQVDGLDLTAPAALRPFAVAAVAADNDRGRATGAGGDRHQPGGRRPGRRAGRPAAGRAGGGLPGLGDAAARAAVAPLATPSAGGWPCCAGWPTRTRPTRTAAPGRCGWSSRRSGRCSSRSSRGSATWSRCELRRRRRGRPGRGRPPADRPGVRPGRPGHQARRVRGPRRHPRRLPAHRRAPVAGRVLGRRGGGDPHLRRRRPAHHRAGRRGCGRRRAGSCCSPRRSARGPPRSPSEHPELAEILDKLAEGIPVEGMESLAPALLGGPTRWSCCCDCMPAGTHVLLCDPERIRTRAHDLVRTREEFLQASWAAAAVGGQAPVDLGAAAFRTLAEVRAAAGELGQPWWSLSPVRPGRGRAGAGRGRALAEDDAGAGRRSPRTTAIAVAAVRPAGAALPRRDRAGSSTTSSAGPATAGGSRWSSRGTARPSGRSRCCATPASASGWSRRCRPRPTPASWWSPAARSSTGSSTRRPGSRVHHRQRHHRRPRRVHPGHAQDAEPAAQHDRPAGAARPATSWCTSSTASAGTSSWCSARSTAPTASTWSSSTPPSKRGQPGDRLFVPTDQLDQLSRYVGGEQPDPAQDGRLGLAEGQGPGPQGGPGDRRAAHPALRRPQGVQGARVRPGHAVAAGAGGRLPVARRRPTSSPRSRRSSGDMEQPSRWTG